MGDTPNIAARLQGLAAPNTVVLSAVTARLLHGVFLLEDLGVHQLKGVAEHMPVFCVLGAGAPAGDEVEPSLARTHLEQGIALTDLMAQRAQALRHGEAPGVRCLTLAANILWCLGAPAQAVWRSQQALALAQELAHRGGERVRRLVLCATMAGGAPVPGDPRVLAILATPLRYWSPSYLDRVAPRLYGPDVAGNPEMMAHQRRARFTRAPSARGYLGQVLALRRFASVLWLHRLRQPTLVLTGESDRIVPVANGRILASRIPNARLEVVEGGHLFLLTHAAETARRVNDFLDAPDG